MCYGLYDASFSFLKLVSFLESNFWLLIIKFSCNSLGSLRYWYERNQVDLLVSKSAVWDDSAVSDALDCAAFWVKGLPFVKSLSGYWKFLLAQNPTCVPSNFQESLFEDSAWPTIPGNMLLIFILEVLITLTCLMTMHIWCNVSAMKKILTFEFLRRFLATTRWNSHIMVLLFKVSDNVEVGWDFQMSPLD